MTFYSILSVLYASCLVGNLVEQLWNFAWPSAIAMLHPSLLPVAVMGFVTKLAIIIGGPVVGKFMDHSPRVPTYISLNVVQVIFSRKLNYSAKYFPSTCVIEMKCHKHNFISTCSGSSSSALCRNDNSCIHGSFHTGVINSPAALVFCFDIRRGH